MQQFNLDKALNGAKLVTRDGREVEDFGRREPPGEYYHEFAAYIGQVRYGFHSSGKPTNDKDYCIDLFLSDEPNPATIHPFILKVSEMASNDAELQTLLNTFLNDYPQFKIR